MADAATSFGMKYSIFCARCKPVWLMFIVCNTCLALKGGATAQDICGGTPLRPPGTASG